MQSKMKRKSIIDIHKRSQIALPFSYFICI